MTSINNDLRLNEINAINTEESGVNDWAPQFAYRRIVAKRLSLGDFSGAIQTASKIKWEIPMDGTLYYIYGQCEDLKIAESAVEKMKSAGNRLGAYRILMNKHYLNGNANEVARISKIREKNIKLAKMETAISAGACVMFLIAVGVIIDSRQ